MTYNELINSDIPLITLNFIEDAVSNALERGNGVLTIRFELL